MIQIPLKDVCHVSMGQAPDGSSYNDLGEGFPLIAGAGDFGPLSPKPKKFTTEPTRISEVDDVILCIRATIGDLNWSDKAYCLGRGVAGLRPSSDKLDRHYLWHWLSSQKDYLFSQGTGSTFKQISRSTIDDLSIPLPPLPEQKRIAAILDKADSIRRKRQEAVRLTEELLRSVFLEMFGDPVMNPKGWESVQLAGVCNSADDIKCGPFGTQLGKDEFTDEGVPLWGIRNVNKLFKLPTREFLEPRTAQRLKQYSIEPGDIVMTRKGTIGNCAVYPENFPPGIMHSDLLRLRINRKVCEPAFLAHQLHYSRAVEQQIELISGGAVMPGINVTKLKYLKVLIPPIEKQTEFTRRTDSIKKLSNSHSISLASFDALFSSLLQTAFKGML